MRMGRYSRLLIAILVALCAFPYVLLCQTQVAGADALFQREARQLGNYLAATLPPLSTASESAPLNAMLAAALPLNRDLVSIAWDSRERHLEASAPATPARYPAWFGRLVKLHRGDASFAFAGGATLTLSPSPTRPLNRLWDMLVAQAAVGALLIGLLISLLAGLFSSPIALLRRKRRVGRRLALRASAMEAQAEPAPQTPACGQFDALTGLPNRAALSARFEQALAQARERRLPLAVCLFDMDYFQHINERHGPECGDDILAQVAQRLRGHADGRHYAARLGADEFVVLLSGQADVAAIEGGVAQLLAELQLPYLCDAAPLTVSLSAGVAIYSGGDCSTETLLRHADHAVYQAKLTGRSRAHFFDASLDRDVRTHHNQRTEVRLALRCDQLCLYYQPKVNMRSGRVVGMEALLRWRNPRRGVLEPAQFLPLVEHTDLIIDIGEWVLRQALRQMQLWGRAGRHWVVSVNIAARHFQRPDFVARLKAILADYPGVAPSMLELEILESSALDDIEHVRRVMRACQALGIAFALDDFGTGYSSLSYLKRLPADILKIDQSFVRNMLVNQDDLHLVSAVINLANSFKLSVIAEGVESVAHGARLMQLGCDLAQGYGIARPMPADAVPRWVEEFIPAPAWQTGALSLV